MVGGQTQAGLADPAASSRVWAVRRLRGHRAPLSALGIALWARPRGAGCLAWVNWKGRLGLLCPSARVWPLLSEDWRGCVLFRSGGCAVCAGLEFRYVVSICFGRGERCLLPCPSVFVDHGSNSACQKCAVAGAAHGRNGVLRARFARLTAQLMQHSIRLDNSAYRQSGYHRAPSRAH